MTRRDLFYKWLFYSLAALLWLVIQHALLNRLDFWGGVHPFVLPMIPAMSAILEKRQESTLFSVCAGLFCDLLMPAPIPCFYTLTFLAIALLCAVIAARVILTGFLCAAVCSVLASCLSSALQILFLAPALEFPVASALSLAGRELLLSLPFSPLLFLSFRFVWRLIRNE